MGWSTNISAKTMASSDFLCKFEALDGLKMWIVKCTLTVLEQKMC
jgi:hypothetical protein